jgi:hypothetical protein
MNTWPIEVPKGALLLHWPTRFSWTSTSAVFGKKVREHGGAVFPLNTVLGRLGLGQGGRLEQLREALAPELSEVEDPRLLGDRLIEALALRLLDVPLDDSENPLSEKPCVYPAIQELLPIIPTGPGTYSFHAADETVLYLGKAKSLNSRVPEHFGPAGRKEIVERARRLEWEETGSELEALLLEQLRLADLQPLLNTQETVHRRRRGKWRDARALLVLPSVAPGRVEVCLVAGDGRFHWERVRQRARLPRGLWLRVRSFVEGERTGWAPGRAGRNLTPDEAKALTEITLTWLASYGDRISQIDLRSETTGRSLMTRVRRLLGEDPGEGRVEVVAGPGAVAAQP